MRTIYRDGRWRTQSATAYRREKHLEREFAANKKARRTNSEVRKMVEDTEPEPEVVRELVGDGGEYFQQVPPSAEYSLNREKLESVALVFGYGDDYEGCTEIIGIVGKVNYLREYRCVPAN